MKKIIAITLKELTLILRDRTALLLMIVAPIALTGVMAFAFGAVNTGGGLSPVEVVVVNEDEGNLGQVLADTLQSEGLSDLLVTTLAATPAEARALVDEDKAAAAVLIPSGLTERVTAQDASEAVSELVVYGNPGRPIGAGIVRSIVERFAQQVAAGTVGAQVTVSQLVESGRLAPQDIASSAPEIGERVAMESAGRQLVTIAQSAEAEESSGGFNFLAYYAPSLAILFLMFAMTSSARTLISEREIGTLDRMRSTPTPASQLLGGKVSGVFITGLLQMIVLIVATRYLMGVMWGDPLGVAVFVALVVAATASLGLVIASVARTSAQANAIGGAVVMVLAAVGGSFVPRISYPNWLKTLGLIGPNSWGIEGFQKLAAGATLSGLTTEIVALLAMTIVFFGIAVWNFRRVVK